MEISHRFGRFEVRPNRRQLLVDDQVVALHARAFDVLLALIERRGSLVTKGELLDAVWSGLVVEENNLVVQVGALRKVLGAGAIATIPGRGYRLAVELESDKGIRAPGSALAGVALPPRLVGNLPAKQPVAYGRSTEIEDIKALLDTRTLVTLVGAGGIGKTRIAQAIAWDLRDRWVDGAWVVELAALSDAGSLPGLIAQVLRAGLPGSQAVSEDVARLLGCQSLLLVLDNCEHLLDAVCELVLRIAAEAPNVRILATSQEPLRLPDEQQVRILPLAVPTTGGLVEARAFGAIALFESRVSALDPCFALTDDNLVAAVDICRRLDGLPLAIELAAARVPALGVEGVRRKIDERFQLLAGGWRGALPRHQTLRATLEWSHGRLSPEEQALFRRLAVVAGSFTSDLAIAVASGPQQDEWATLDLLSSLVEKSLVVAAVGEPPRYRLLESARAFAAERLAASGEMSERRRRHALAVAAHFEQLDNALITGRVRTHEFDAALSPELDGLREAMGWGLSEPEQLEAAMRLAASAVAIEDVGAECARWLLAIEPRVDVDLSSIAAARFWLAFARPSMYGRVPAASRREGAKRAAAILRALGHHELRFYALLRLTRHHVKAGDPAAAASTLHEAQELEQTQWPTLLRIRLFRLRAYVESNAGAFDAALRDLQEAISCCEREGDFIAEDDARTDLADVLWGLGRLKEASIELRLIVDRKSTRRPASNVLAMAYSNLLGVLYELGQTEEATQAARDGLPHMRRSRTVATSLDNMTCLMCLRGQLVVAARLLGASDAQVGRHGEGRDPNERRGISRARQTLESAFGNEVLAAHLAEGATLGADALEGMIAAALEPSALG